MNTKEILKYMIWAGIYVVLIVPFIVANGMFFPYITGKAFAFRIIVEIIFGLWLILIMKDKEFRPKFSWIAVSVITLVSVLLVADIFAIAPYKAFWSNFERMEGWITFIHLSMYFLVLGSMFKKEKLWLWFLRLNLVAGALMAVSSISEGIKEGVIRFAGPLGNPIYISVYFLFIFFFALFILYQDVLAKKLTNWSALRKVFANVLFYVYLAIALMSLFVMYRTSRGALLGVIGGVFVGAVLLAVFEKENKVTRQIALGTIIAIVAVVGIFFGLKDTSFIRNNPTLSRFAEISWSNVNGQARQLVWPMALKGFEEKPILGWGQEGFNYVFNKYYDPRMWGQESWFDRAHDAPLDFLVAAGLLGLLSYLALFGSALYLLWFRHNNINIAERAILTGLFTGYLFQAIFVFDNLVSYVMFFTTLAYVHSRLTNIDSKIIALPNSPHSYNKNIKESEEVPGYLSIFVQDEEYQNYILIPLVIIATTFIVWWVNIPSLNANQTLIQALGLLNAGRVTDSMEAFKTALAYKSMGDSEIREQLLSAAPEVLKMTGVDQEVKKEFLALTVDEAEKQIALVPNDARYYVLMGSLLNNIGGPEQALPYIKKAIELTPNKQMARFELIQSLIALGKNEEGMAEAKTAYELDKSYDRAKLFYSETVKNEIKVNPKFKVEGEQILKDLYPPTAN